MNAPTPEESRLRRINAMLAVHFYHLKRCGIWPTGNMGYCAVCGARVF